MNMQSGSGHNAAPSAQHYHSDITKNRKKVANIDLQNQQAIMPKQPDNLKNFNT